MVVIRVAWPTAAGCPSYAIGGDASFPPRDPLSQPAHGVTVGQKNLRLVCTPINRWMASDLFRHLSAGKDDARDVARP